MGSNREKSNIAIAILEKLPSLMSNKNYSLFDGSNNIFVDCTWQHDILCCVQWTYLQREINKSLVSSLHNYKMSLNGQ